MFAVLDSKSLGIIGICMCGSEGVIKLKNLWLKQP